MRGVELQQRGVRRAQGALAAATFVGAGARGAVLYDGTGVHNRRGVASCCMLHFAAVRGFAWSMCRAFLLYLSPRRSFLTSPLLSPTTFSLSVAPPPISFPSAPAPFPPSPPRSSRVVPSATRARIHIRISVLPTRALCPCASLPLPLFTSQHCPGSHSQSHATPAPQVLLLFSVLPPRAPRLVHTNSPTPQLPSRCSSSSRSCPRSRRGWFTLTVPRHTCPPGALPLLRLVPVRAAAACNAIRLGPLVGRAARGELAAAILHALHICQPGRALGRRAVFEARRARGALLGVVALWHSIELYLPLARAPLIPS
eukprot:361485-Chlamydomonas_euryale.AAC.3